MLKSENLITTYDKDTFAMNLNHARLAKGLSQADVAKGTGLAKNAISLYESGGSIPSLDRAVAIADYLKVSLDFFTSRYSYCTGQLSAATDVAKTLLLLRDLGIAQVNVGDDASINVSIKDSDIADTLLELDSYIQMKQDGRTASDGRFDGWYEDVYTQKDIRIDNQPFQTFKLSIKNKPFPQNMIRAAFGDEYAGEINDTSIDVDKLIEAMRNTMPQRVYDVLLLRFKDKQTLEEVGNFMSCTRERIRQIEGKGLRYIRENTEIRKNILGIN